jgi:hypothetical protein
MVTCLTTAAYFEIVSRMDFERSQDKEMRRIMVYASWTKKRMKPYLQSNQTKKGWGHG